MNIEQDMKILQQLVAKPPSGGAVVNVISIEQLHIGGNQELLEPERKLLEGAEKESEIKQVSTPKLSYSGEENPEDKFYQNLEFIMDNLPAPRFERMKNMICELAKRKFDTGVAASEWLGISKPTFYTYLNKENK